MTSVDAGDALCISSSALLELKCMTYFAKFLRFVVIQTPLGRIIGWTVAHAIYAAGKDLDHG